MSQENANNAVLITSGCTTGWNDWLWGELWVLPEGLLRLRLRGSRAHVAALSLGLAGTAPRGSKRQIGPEQLPDLLASDRRNRWVPRDQIREAALRKGLMTSRLNVWLTDGTRTKLLWMRTDPAYRVLRPMLHEWLGDRLALR